MSPALLVRDHGEASFSLAMQEFSVMSSILLYFVFWSLVGPPPMQAINISGFSVGARNDDLLCLISFSLMVLLFYMGLLQIIFVI